MMNSTFFLEKTNTNWCSHRSRSEVKRAQEYNNDCDIFHNVIVQLFRSSHEDRHFSILALLRDGASSDTRNSAQLFYTLQHHSAYVCGIGIVIRGILSDRLTVSRMPCEKLKKKVNRTWLKIMWAIFASFITTIFALRLTMATAMAMEF